MQDQFTDFAAFLTRQGLRSTTIRKHLNCLKYLKKHCIDLTSQAVESHLILLKSQNKSGSYLNMFIFAMRWYGKFTNQDLYLKEFKRSATSKATLSDDEIEAYLDLPRRKNEPFVHFIKYKMFWQLVAFTGMRPGECAVLKPEHIDWGRGIIVIETSKTNQPGQVPIPANLKDCLKLYLDTLDSSYLFSGARGGNSYSAGGPAVIDNVDWHHDWTCRLKILKLVRPHLTPYSFRHSYATRLLEENVSLFHVKKLMRHQDLKSTLVYEHLTTKDLIEAQQKLPLIRKATDARSILQGMGLLVKSFHIEKDNRFKYQLIEDESSLRFECSIEPTKKPPSKD